MTSSSRAAHVASRPVEVASHQFAELGLGGDRGGLRLGRGALDPIGARR